jgi:hypothetical protein
MRNHRLHTALSTFAEEAAWQLAADNSGGEELPFEIAENASADRYSAPLYCYRPLTSDFIRDHRATLVLLPSHLPAARALSAVGGVGDYLRACGADVAGTDVRLYPELALQVFLQRAFEDASEFVLTPDRFERAYGELESCLYEGRHEIRVVVPVLGMTIASEEVDLGDGVTLVRGETIPDAPTEAVWHATQPDEANVLAVVTLESATGEDAALTQSRLRLRRLLGALRLYDGSGVTLGPVGWLKPELGGWQSAVLGFGAGRARSACIIDAEQEDELRAFVSLVARRTPRQGPLAWALARYEMSCERVMPFEALTDVLLALRALLEPEGAESGRLSGRLAALCAVREDRPLLQERLARSIALERAVVAGIAPMDPEVDESIEELAGHLRAILRDVLCGHLDPDLRTLADELIQESVPWDQPTAH